MVQNSLKRLLKRLEKLYPKYIDLSLERLIKLLTKLNNPHLKLPPIIHIAGTNGKGSTLNYIRSVLESAGYKVHLYASPHIISFDERICLSGKRIKQKELKKILLDQNIQNEILENANKFVQTFLSNPGNASEKFLEYVRTY